MHDLPGSLHLLNDVCCSSGLASEAVLEVVEVKSENGVSDQYSLWDHYHYENSDKLYERYIGSF